MSNPRIEWDERSLEACAKIVWMHDPKVTVRYETAETFIADIKQAAPLDLASLGSWGCYFGVVYLVEAYAEDQESYDYHATCSLYWTNVHSMLYDIKKSRKTSWGEVWRMVRELLRWKA